MISGLPKIIISLENYIKMFFTLIARTFDKTLALGSEKIS